MTKKKKDTTTPTPIELPEIEVRFQGGEIEVRRGSKGVGITGFIPFASKSVDMYGFRETVNAGAFDKTLKEGDDIVSAWNHDPLWVLGRRSNDTLTFAKKADGLEYDVELDEDDAIHRHFARRVERRDVTGSSFTFRTIRDEWKYNKENKPDERELLEVQLFEIGPVTFPAYPKSDAQKRAISPAVCDIASVRCGPDEDELDLAELAGAICRAEDGIVAGSEDGALVRRWITRMIRYLPADEVVPAAVTLARRERLKEIRDRYTLES
jgi:HK97 family phage prohead protease